MADCTSCAAASMSRSRSNCSVIWLSPKELCDDMVGERRDLAELAFERRRDERRDRVRVGAGQLRRDLDGREIDLRQRRDRQLPIAEDAGEQHRDRQQRRRDRPQDEGRRDVHRRGRAARGAAGGPAGCGCRARLAEAAAWLARGAGAPAAAPLGAAAGSGGGRLWRRPSACGAAVPGWAAALAGRFAGAGVRVAAVGPRGRRLAMPPCAGAGRAAGRVAADAVGGETAPWRRRSAG